MPKSITFFSRGKTPIYVNYVIAHNNVGRPLRDMYDLLPRLLEELSQSLTGRSRGASTRSVLQTIKPSANHEPLAANHLKRGLSNLMGTV